MSNSAIGVTEFSKRLFNDFSSNSKILKEAENKIGTDQAADIFLSLYQAKDPGLTNDKATHAETLKHILKTREFDLFRENTIQDPLESVFATSALIDVFKKIENAPADIKQSVARVGVGKAEEAAAQMSQNLDAVMEQVFGDAKSIQGSGTGGGAGEQEREHIALTTTRARMLLADKLSSSGKFKNIAELVGRFEILFKRGKKQTPHQAASQIAGVELGANPSKILPSELAMPDEVFDRKFLDRSLLQFKVADKLEEGRGPLIVLVDKSTSMGGLVLGSTATRDDWSAALSLSLLRVAREGKRSIVFIPYSNVPDYAHIVELHNGQCSIDNLDSIIGEAPNGGTRFQPAFEVSFDFLEGTKALHGMDKADVVLITDGDDRIYRGRDIVNEIDSSMKAEIISNLAKYDCRLFTIAIGAEGGCEALKAISEQSGGLYVDSAELNDEGMAGTFGKL